MARDDGFSNRRLRTIRPKNNASSRCERMKFGHSRERRRQNLGAVLARVVPRFGCQRWMPRQLAPRHARSSRSSADPLTANRFVIRSLCGTRGLEYLLATSRQPRLSRSCSALVPVESGPHRTESLAVRGAGKAALDKPRSSVILSYDRWICCFS